MPLRSRARPSRLPPGWPLPNAHTRPSIASSLNPYTAHSGSRPCSSSQTSSKKPLSKSGCSAQRYRPTGRPCVDVPHDGGSHPQCGVTEAHEHERSDGQDGPSPEERHAAERPMLDGVQRWREPSGALRRACLERRAMDHTPPTVCEEAIGLIAGVLVSVPSIPAAAPNRSADHTSHRLTTHRTDGGQRDVANRTMSYSPGLVHLPGASAGRFLPVRPLMGYTKWQQWSAGVPRR